MIKMPWYSNRKILVVSILSALSMLEGCNKEEDSEAHLQRGKEYFEKGEYDKAKLELKSSNQTDQETAETYYYLALLDEKNQQFKAMKENLTRTIELAPTFTAARLKLGKVLLLFGQLDEATEQAEYVLKDESQNLEALALKASILIRQKKEADALAILDNILKDHPDNADALSLKAMVYMEKEDYPKALELIEAAKKYDPKNISLDIFKIQMDAKAKNLDAVITDYQKLVESNPDNQEFKITLAKIYSQSGKTKEAEDVLQGLVDSEPNNIRAELLLLDFYQATAPDKIDKQFLQFTEQHKKQPRMLLALADWMIARKNFDQAKKVLNTVIELEENSNVGLGAKTILAKIAFDLKKTDEAQKIVDEILESNSNYDDAKILNARLLLVKEQYDEAIDLLTKVTWSKPDSDEAMLLLAQSLLVKGDTKQADKQFISALQANPGNLQAFVYVYEKSLKAGDLQYAKEILEKTLRLYPANLGLLEKQGQLHLSEKNWSAAKETVEKIAKTPDPLANNLASILSGKILQGQGEYAKAAEIYRQVLAQIPENSDVLGNLAQCYEKLNKRGEMIVFLNNMLNKNPQNISAGILLSDLLILDKQFDKASVILAGLITNNTRIASLYISHANVKLAQNDKQGALSVYHEGLKYNPDDLKLTLSLAALNKVMGDYAAAIERYESLLVKNPLFDIAINNLAIVLAENYDDEVHLKKAGELAEKLKDSPQPYYKDTYAWVSIKRGEFRQGLSILNDLVTKFPDEPIFRYHLAFAHHKNGQIGSAISELKQSLEIAKRKGAFPEQKNAEKLLEEILAKPKQS